MLDKNELDKEKKNIHKFIILRVLLKGDISLLCLFE